MKMLITFFSPIISQKIPILVFHIARKAFKLVQCDIGISSSRKDFRSCSESWIAIFNSRKNWTCIKFFESRNISIPSIKSLFAIKYHDLVFTCVRTTLMTMYENINHSKMSLILIRSHSSPNHPLGRRHYKFLHLRRYYLLYSDLQSSVTNKLWQICQVFRTQNFRRIWNFDGTVSPRRENFRVVMNIQCDILLLDFQFRSVAFQNSRELIIRTFPTPDSRLPSLDSNRCMLEHFRSNTPSSLNYRGNDTSEQAAIRLRRGNSCDQHFDKVP